MSTVEKIQKMAAQLADDQQNKVLEFIEALLGESPRANRVAEDAEWQDLSLYSALRDVEEAKEVEYTFQDMIERWR